MLVFLIFLVILYFTVVFAVTLPYWYELGNSPCEDIPSVPYAPKPVAKLLFEVGFSALQLGIAFVLDPIMRHIEKADQHEDRADYPPVLLVHGLYHNPSGWMYMKKALRKAGFRKIHTVAYSSWNTSIEAVTTHLESSVNSLEEQYKGRKPILVGHSLGGLIIRNWLAGEKNRERALGAVTLGAPHRGSKMAAVAFGTLGKSLKPANPFFEELAQKEKEAAIPCVSLVSEADTMVLPQKNLIPVTKGWTMRITPYASHTGILTNSAVCRMVAWELHRMAVDAPRPKPEEKAAEAPISAVMEKPVAMPAVKDLEPKPESEVKPEKEPDPEAGHEPEEQPEIKPEPAPAAEPEAVKEPDPKPEPKPEPSREAPEAAAGTAPKIEAGKAPAKSGKNNNAASKPGKKSSKK